MQDDPLKPYTEWTQAKLRYAEVHLNELRKHRQRATGDDFERTHQEAFLYQLLGARDAFLQELNVCYGCKLELQKVRVATLRKALKEAGETGPELEELASLEKRNESWLSAAKELRDYSTHRRGVPRIFSVGGEEDGQVRFMDPRSGEKLQKNILDSFEDWLREMGSLLNRLRESAR